MNIRVGESYRYRIGNYVVNTFFLIESFDGSRYTGRVQFWPFSVWYFDSNGHQIGTSFSPDSGVDGVSLIIEDE